jgi:hypothetical protein
LPLPVAADRIDEEQDRVGRPFPAGLRERLLRSNGGEVFIGDEEWTLFPVWDPGSKPSAGRLRPMIRRDEAVDGLASSSWHTGSVAQPGKSTVKIAG